jgi:hypothetical protein
VPHHFTAEKIGIRAYEPFLLVPPKEYLSLSNGKNFTKKSSFLLKGLSHEINFRPTKSRRWLKNFLKIVLRSMTLTNSKGRSESLIIISFPAASLSVIGRFSPVFTSHWMQEKFT